MDAAAAWVSIETRLFVNGMTIHSSGKLTRGDVSIQDYAVLKTGSIWFRSEELQKAGLMVAAETGWRSVTDNPRRQEWRNRFNQLHRRGQNWVCGADLAQWYTRRPGAVTTSEADALYEEACCQLFRSLLDGDFVEYKLRPRVKPHLVSDAGVSRMVSEHAEFFRGVHWAGGYGRDGEQVLSNGILRELMRDVWLPARLILPWCGDRNIRPPPWLSTRDRGDVGLTLTPAGRNAKADVGPLGQQSRGKLIKRPRSPCEQSTDALIQIHDGGLNIIHMNRDELHTLALKKTGFEKNSRGNSRRTFERALAAALGQIRAR